MKSTNTLANNRPSDYRQHVTFEVKGEKIDAWVFMPDHLVKLVGCVVMSNGFGGTKGMILEQYALRVREAGYASLLYDFRHFGESSGEPRQLFSGMKQQEDLDAAIEFARQIEGVDSSKIVLWGTSAAGGYGLTKAAKDKSIAAVIGQCPALDKEEDAKLGLERQGMAFYLKLFIHAQRDKGRSRFGLSPHKIPIVGPEGAFAMLNAPGAFEGYASLVDNGFVNEVCARAMIVEQAENPLDSAGDVECPVLLQICEKDNLVSEKSYMKAAKILGDKVEIKLYPVGHFDIYKGEAFDQAVSDQISFLNQHLK